MKLRILYGLFLVLGIVSCRRSFDPIAEHTWKIFPLATPSTKIYSVLDTIYDTPAVIGYEVLNYRRKEVVIEPEIDLMGREIYPRIISRAFHNDTLSPDQWNYEYLYTWSEYKNDDRAERMEENIRYQALQFPVVEGRRWDGNAFNEGTPKLYEYINTDTTVELNGMTFPNCVFVLQTPYGLSDFPSYYRVQHAYEIYAPDIGLIKRYFKFFEIQGASPEEGSRILKEELIDYY